MKSHALLFGLLSALFLACGSDEGGGLSSGPPAACVAGKVEACACPGSTAQGAQACQADGSYGPCLGCPSGAGGSSAGGQGGAAGKGGSLGGQGGAKAGSGGSDAGAGGSAAGAGGSGEPVATEVVVDGGKCGTGAQIQAGMDSAAAKGLPLRLVGTFYISTTVNIPDNLYIQGGGAKFYLSSTPPAACDGGPGAYNAGRIRNATKGSAAGYGQAGGFTWDGGEFDGNRDGIMTFSHSPGFTVKNCTFYSWCYYNSSGDNNTGHAIEINSSGGADNTDGPYTVQILNNTFLGVYSQRPWSNDEPVHWDWNWNGSGGTPPFWEVGDPANSTTQTMCHNVLIQGNTFHRKDESGTWKFALCAIGGHDSSDAAIKPATRHNHFLIDGNKIHGAVGASANVQSDKGAIHLFRVRQAKVTNNEMFGCTASRLVSAENKTDAGYCSAAGNTHNGAPAGNTIVVQGAAPEDQ